MTIGVPKPEPREKKPRKRLQAKTPLARKAAVKKVNKARMDRRAKEYRRYMQSSEWRLRRLAALAAANWTCQRCKYVQRTGTAAIADLLESREFQVHHKTYARFGNERVEDLEVLCEVCHQKEHASRLIKPRFKRAG